MIPPTDVLFSDYDIPLISGPGTATINVEISQFDQSWHIPEGGIAPGLRTDQPYRWRARMRVDTHRGGEYGEWGPWVQVNEPEPEVDLAMDVPIIVVPVTVDPGCCDDPNVRLHTPTGRPFCANCRTWLVGDSNARSDARDARPSDHTEESSLTSPDA